ncbi:Cj0069 family protein [Rivibacter subsaxonicus]|uniref:DUF6815 domain-containing protein n=1 Tax=Rivibacter subsaxonicus TaxID=457575 RepID=A0A4Q7VNF4_9BURK|nr:Cj0069 family protein [Rivibacter subsaxonicus]RZT97839.1 hypothetical protein EV670_2239 [Rivibacter subsaxonicus]
MGSPVPVFAILYPGDRTARDRSDPAASRFAALFDAFALAGVQVEPAVYHDDFCDEVEAQLLRLRGVLVWHNPVEGGRSRRMLDAMLQRVASAGVFVSAHPQTIIRMGTKDVLVATRDLPFGCDTHRVDSIDQLIVDLPRRLAQGPRVLKQHRGHSGIGVWRIAQEGADSFALQHAQRGSTEEHGPLSLVLERLAPYFAAGGHMVDQAWQRRLPEGMVRAYLVRDRVAGFGHQAVNALYPAAPGEPAPQPGPRLYSGPEDGRFQPLRRLLEGEWVDMLAGRLGIASDRLPVLWDADFLLGESSDPAQGRYVLCEINVSSVAPYPETANAEIVKAIKSVLAAS